MLNLVGQFGPLLGTRLYPDEAGPFYVRGMGVCGGFMLGVAGLAWWLRVILVRENDAVRKETDAEEEEEEGLVEGGARRRRRKGRLVNIL